MKKALVIAAVFILLISFAGCGAHVSGTNGDDSMDGQGRREGEGDLAVIENSEEAAAVEEALELLSQYDLHASMNYMVHFAIADADGNSVAVEYIDNEMVVTKTPVLTNFYLAEGEKQGIDTGQSHERFDILTETLTGKPSMTQAEVRDALDSVSKDNFGEFESTDWSIVFDQSALTATYYHRENYGNAYFFQIMGK